MMTLLNCTISCKTSVSVMKMREVRSEGSSDIAKVESSEDDISMRDPHCEDVLSGKTSHNPGHFARNSFFVP